MMAVTSGRQVCSVFGSTSEELREGSVGRGTGCCQMMEWAEEREPPVVARPTNYPRVTRPKNNSLKRFEHLRGHNCLFGALVRS